MKHFKHITILVVLSALSANAYPTYGFPPGIGFGRPCTGDELRNVIGECVLPEISRNIFVYAAPKVIPSPRPRPSIPKPEVHYDFVFVKTADQAKQNDPIIVPPPQQKTLVYVLSKKQEQGGESIIRSPYFPAPRPEVFYVNYGEGDNPQLPGGVDLETALNSGATQGQKLNFQNPNFGTSQIQGNNNNEHTIDIDERIIASGLVSPAIKSQPIEGGYINSGAVRSGILLSNGIPIGQGPVDSGFGQDDGIQQPSSPVLSQNPTISQGVQVQRASLGYTSPTPSAPTDFSPAPVSPSPTSPQYTPLPLSSTRSVSDE